MKTKRQKELNVESASPIVSDDIDNQHLNIEEKRSEEIKKLVVGLMEKRTEIDNFLKVINSDAELSKERFALLLKVAYQSTRALNHMCKQKPEWAKLLSKQMRAWPVIASPSEKKLKEIGAYLDDLELGRDYRAPVGMKSLNKRSFPALKWTLKALDVITIYRLEWTPQNIHSMDDVQYLYSLYVPFLIRSYDDFFLSGEFPEKDWSDWDDNFKIVCCKLPPLSEASVKTWMEAIKMWLMHVTDDSPENHPELGPIGKHKGAQFTEGSLSSKSAIRHAIYSAIEQALRNLVKP